MHLSFITKEVIRTMQELQNKSNSMKLIPPNDEAVKRGLLVSANACRQEEYVAMTPIMKHILQYCGDLNESKTRLTAEEALTCKAKTFLGKVVEAALLKFNGQKRNSYNVNLGVADKDHYDTDCWLQAARFLDPEKPLFDIVPGQAEQRAEMLLKYETPTKLKTKDMIKFITASSDSFYHDISIQLLFEDLPQVKAEQNFKLASMPFTAKDSGTSYPEYHNDRKPVSKDSQITYGQLEINYVLNKTNNLRNIWALWDRNVFTAYGRNQRGKGRAIEAESRGCNLVVNCLEASEMAAYKELPGYTGLCNETVQFERMKRIGEFCEENPEYIATNTDMSTYDETQGEGLLCLTDAIRKTKCVGHLAKDIADFRYCCANKAYLVDGANNKLSVVYGRRFSGYDDTTLGNTNTTRYLDIFSNIALDPDWVTKVWRKGIRPEALGDDLLSIRKRGLIEKVSKLWAKYGIIAKPEKEAFGLFFLQQRMFKDKEGNWIMSYPWPRVFLSELSKEEPKGLLPYGWEMALFAPLGNLVKNKEAFAIVVNLILPFDDLHLCKDMTADQIKAKIKEEDEEAKSKLSDEQKWRFKGTWEKLSSGNPMHEDRYENNGEMKNDYIEKMIQMINEVYDPDFYTKLGFKTPKVN